MSTKDELEASAAAVQEKFAVIKQKLVDLRDDQKAAFEELKKQIAEGTIDLGPAMAALGDALGVGDSIIEDIGTMDKAAEDVSGKPTP